MCKFRLKEKSREKLTYTMISGENIIDILLCETWQDVSDAKGSKFSGDLI